MADDPKQLTCAQRMIIRAVREAAYALASITQGELRAAANFTAASSAYTACALLAKASGLPEHVLALVDAGDPLSFDEVEREILARMEMN